VLRLDHHTDAHGVYRTEKRGRNLLGEPFLSRAEFDGDLGVEIGSGERQRPDGVRLSWRVAGIPGDDPAERLRPFFIQWDDASDAGAVAVPHPAGRWWSAGDGDGTGLEQWLAHRPDRRPVTPRRHRRCLLGDDGDSSSRRRCSDLTICSLPAR
jgi:hypothetical protein